MKNFILFLMLVCSTVVFGQAVTFSNDRIKFVKELQSSMAQYATEDQKQFIKKELTVALLETKEISDKYFTNMVNTSNALLTKRFNLVPDVYNYIFSIYSLVKNKQSEASYTAFQNTIDKLLESKNPKRFTDFADMSAGFFSTKKLAGKSNFEWFYMGGNYEFKYDDKPYIQFTGGNLVCKALENGSSTKYVDSMVVYNTSGTYDPSQQRWEGKGGRVTWEKVGLSKNETYAEVGNLKVSMKNTNMNIDSVRLKSPYLGETILGSLSDRAFKSNREEDKIFPQFLSYNSNVKINNIKPNVNYEGAFSMKGAKFVGSGIKDIPAKIVILKNAKPFIVAKAASIFISDKNINVPNCNTKIVLNTGDSITHPSNTFTYYYNEGTAEFSRPSSGLGQAPFEDSYHKLFYYVPKIVLNEKENKIYFTYEKGTSQEQRVAKFESFNYYDGQLYDQLQGLSSVHPLVAISKYCYKYDKQEITEGECAAAIGGTIEQAKSMMLQLSNNGFISYDIENKKVFVNEKLDNFVKGKAGKKDYDNILFMCDFRPKELKGYSEEDIKSNAYLQQIRENYKVQNEKRRVLENFGFFNMGTMDISFTGIDKITLSDKQNVHLFPSENNVVVKQNRDIEFSGWINAGKAEINATSALYNYEANKINLIKTNETIFRVKPRKAEHGTAGLAMNSKINGVVGDIVVDSPNNRSGNKEDATTAIYPVFSVKNATKVYYNSPELHKGAYDSTRFYYTIQPFVLDSADNFNDFSWRLKGELVSAGIFPVIKEDLKVMPDYSFGFSTAAPKEGFDFYGTAKYDNKVMLSGNGLQGAGTIKFVKSTSVSKSLLTFLPDSTVGVVSFVNEPVESGIQFPDVKCEEAYLTYIPRKKILKASSMPRSEFEFFNKEANLKGTTIVTPNGMEGNGLMTFKTATIVSTKFKYEHKDIFADTSSFNLRNQSREEGEAPLIFETNNVKSHVSFKERKGEFNSNKGESRVDFPVNQYMCKMDKFTWFMDQEELTMEKQATKDVAINAGVDLLGPNFFSTHPKQDSLQFRAPKAKLDMKAKTIYCNEVEYIDVADARIYPDSMKVNIRKKAKLDQFTNATIIANYITKYHKFTKAVVDITARRAYTGSGEYPYYDRDSILSNVVMNSITLDSTFQTVANGKIEQNAGFKLSPEFDYYGNITVKAASPEILFNGATRINHNCSNFEKNWLAFTSNVDPKNVQIPVSSTMTNLENQAISAGIVWRDAANVDSIALYPTFLSKLVSPTDPIVATSSGFLMYDNSTKEYQIASKEKLINRSAKGNFLSMNTETCALFAEGIINLGMDHGDVTVSTAGMVDYNSNTGEALFNLTAKFDIPIDKSILKNIPEKINLTEGLKPMDFTTNTLKSSITAWGTQAEADKLQENYTLKGEVKNIPNCLESTFTITGIRLNYYSQPKLNNFKGLITTSESAILVNMFDKPVMKYIPFKAFFQQKYSGAGGDWFAFLIDIPGGKDYFFNYSMGKKEGMMDIMTGDTELSTEIAALKEDKRKKKNFTYQIGRGGLKTVFYNLFGN